jgi:hypothetical protein
MSNWNRNEPTRFQGQGGYGWDSRSMMAGDAAGVQDGFFTAAFNWMFLALLVSAATAFFTLTNSAAFDLAANGYLALIIAELVLVLVLSAAINRMSSTMAAVMLFVYAALNGATFAMVLAVYDLGSVTIAFVGAAAVFGAAALYGAVTGRDLTSIGGILFAGLIGLVVASLANLFVGGDQLSFIIGIVGVAIFTGLTAFDVQRIKDGRMPRLQNPQSGAVLGALALYLDFVNLFLDLLRLMVPRGSSRG